MLDELERLAREALAWSETIGEERWYEGRELVELGKINVGKFNDVQSIDESDAAYIAAANPATVLKLIAVARAGQDASELIDRISSGHEWGAIEEYGQALREAIDALKEPT